MGCRQEACKADLLRLVRTAVGGVVLDRTGRLPGRGAYLHASSDCVQAAQKRRALERAMGSPVGPALWAELSALAGLRPSS